MEDMIHMIPVLASSSFDDLENKLTILKILVFAAFIGIPVIKFLFGKKDK